jgi:hypothetical protein
MYYEDMANALTPAERIALNASQVSARYEEYAAVNPIDPELEHRDYAERAAAWDAAADTRDDRQ